LIRRDFLGVFRFAQMALADAGIPTHANNKVIGMKSLQWKAHTPIIEMADKPAMTSRNRHEFCPSYRFSG